MSSMVPEDAPKPRLCHIKKRSDFQGYGFNLHAEKGKAGQYIGKVDDNSPATIAGLKQGDRIVEVNGTNIGNENHQQVVQRIKAVPDETKLLVVDNKADAYYKEKKIVVRGDMPGIACLPAIDGDVTKAEVITEASTVETIAQVNHVGAPAVNGEAHKAQDDRMQEEARAAEPEPAIVSTPPPAEPALVTRKPRDPNDPFAVSAAEMRERIKKGRHSKNEIKSANVSTIDKYQMYQRL